MANNNDIPCEEGDDAIMANNILMQLCILDREDRDSGRQPTWHGITTLAELVRAFDNRTDVAYIAEERLRRLIERDPQNQNVRLMEEGRQSAVKELIFYHQVTKHVLGYNHYMWFELSSKSMTIDFERHLFLNQFLSPKSLLTSFGCWSSPQLHSTTGTE